MPSSVEVLLRISRSTFEFKNMSPIVAFYGNPDGDSDKLLLYDNRRR